MSAGGGVGHVFPLLRPPPPIFLPTFIQNNEHNPTFSENYPSFFPPTPLIHPKPITPQLKKESTFASPNETFTKESTFASPNETFTEDTSIGQIPSVEEKDSSFVSAEKSSTEEQLDHEFTIDSILKSFELGFSHQPLAGSRPTEQSLYAYNNLMKHFSLRGNLDEVRRLFFEMKDFKLNPNVLCYNTVINAHAKHGHHKDAQKLFDEMILLGVTPNLSTFNIFIKLHCFYSKQFNLAYKYFEIMKQFGFEPDSTTYSTLITGLCKTGKTEEAWGVLDSMLAQKCNPTVYTFTPIIQGYCIQGKIDKAKNLMSEMEKLGFPPNTITYNILTNALCKIGRFEEVEKVLEHSQFKGWVPNSITYNTYMNGLCKFGMIKQALEKLEIMIHKGLNPTNVTLGILIDCLCRDSRFLEAQSLLERSLSLNNGIGIVGYNTLMSRLCENGKWHVALKLMSHMVKKGVNFSTRTLNIVINSLCVGGKFRVARNLITCRGFDRNVATYNTLLHWCFLEGRDRERRALLYEMEMYGIALDEITYGIMVEGYFREEKYVESIKFFLESIEGGVWGKNRSFVFLSRLFKNKRYKEILRLFELMKKGGFKIDGAMFDVTLRAFYRPGFCSNSEMYNLCHVLDKMKMLVRNDDH